MIYLLGVLTHNFNWTGSRTVGGMIGADGGSDSWVISILNRVFQCSHRRQSRPITPRGGGQTYAVCLDCGTRVAYDLRAMRAEASVLRISLGRQTPEVGTEGISD